jgi:broad specificity phosphatase PhoE
VSAALYLVRHGATEANLACPPRLQGRRSDPSLAPAGLDQAEAVRAALAAVPLAACYASPLLRATQTAAIVAAPHALAPVPLAALAECDVGRWEGLSWDEVRRREPEELARFLADPWLCPYPEGESLADVHARTAPVLESLLLRHEGAAALVLTHQVVLRACLACWLGLPPAQARSLKFANGSVTLVRRDGEGTAVALPAPLPERAP